MCIQPYENGVQKRSTMCLRWPMTSENQPSYDYEISRDPCFQGRGWFIYTQTYKKANRQTKRQIHTEGHPQRIADLQSIDQHKCLSMLCCTRLMIERVAVTRRCCHMLVPCLARLMVDLAQPVAVVTICARQPQWHEWKNMIHNVTQGAALLSRMQEMMKHYMKF